MSPVFVSHSSLPWLLLFVLAPSSAIHSQEQIQDSSGHESTSSVVSPLSAFLHPTSDRPVGAALISFFAGQTTQCTAQSGQTRLPCPHFRFSVQETGQPCCPGSGMWYQGTFTHLFEISQRMSSDKGLTFLRFYESRDFLSHRFKWMSKI